MLFRSDPLCIIDHKYECPGRLGNHGLMVAQVGQAVERSSVSYTHLVNLVHDVDLLRYLLGEPVAVQGLQSSAARGFETADSAVVNVRFADGALASMTISDATASPWNWEATAREDPQYRPFDADAYFIGGTKGALSLPRLHQFSYDGASNWCRRDVYKRQAKPGGRRAYADNYLKNKGVELWSDESGVAKPTDQ